MRFKKLSTYSVIIAALSFVLIGCGASKTPVNGGTADFSSRSEPDAYGQDDALLAQCNLLSKSQANFSGKLKVHYDAYGNFVADYIELHIDALPDKILTTDSHYMQFLATTEENGQTFSSGHLQIGVARYGDSSVINLDQPFTALSKASIQNFITRHYQTGSGYTLNNFFQYHYLVLLNVDLRYDTLMARFFDHTAGDEHYDFTQALIPAFAADPNIYASNHSLSALMLHPNYQYRDSGYSEAQFQSLTYQYCP